MGGPATRARMQCLLAPAQLAIVDGQEDSALSLGKRAVTLAEAAGDTASVTYVEALATVATQLHNQHRVRDALGAARRTVATLDRIGRNNTLRCWAPDSTKRGISGIWATCGTPTRSSAT